LGIIISLIVAGQRRNLSFIIAAHLQCVSANRPNRAVFLDSSTLATIDCCRQCGPGMAWSRHPQHNRVSAHGVHASWVQRTNVGLAVHFPRVAAVAKPSLDRETAARVGRDQLGGSYRYCSSASVLALPSRAVRKPLRSSRSLCDNAATTSSVDMEDAW